MNNSSQKIHILCIANLRSGGPEALHQLRYYMEQVGLDACMVYTGTTDGLDPMPVEYTTYGIKRKLLKEIEDNENTDHRQQREKFVTGSAAGCLRVCSANHGETLDKSKS